MKYKEYQTKGESVYQKLQNNEPLTKEDMQVIKCVMHDPLGEFVKREAPFRLIEFFGYAKKEVDEDLLGKTEEIIRGTIDYAEDLYYCIDREIRELLDKEEENNE